MRLQVIVQQIHKIEIKSKESAQLCFKGRFHVRLFSNLPCPGSRPSASRFIQSLAKQHSSASILDDGQQTCNTHIAPLGFVDIALAQIKAIRLCHTFEILLTPLVYHRWQLRRTHTPLYMLCERPYAAAPAPARSLRPIAAPRVLSC